MSLDDMIIVEKYTNEHIATQVGYLDPTLSHNVSPNEHSSPSPESNFDGKSKECGTVTNDNISVLNENGQQIISNVVNGGSDNFGMNVDDGHSAEIETHTNNNISYQILQENVQPTASNIKNKECQNSKVNNFDEHLKINDNTCSLLLESVEHTVSVINAGCNILK